MTPSNLWIKICGNTSLRDAELAAEAGADALGFIFAPSPRRITPAQAADLVPHLPIALEKIGVFVDATFQEIESTVQTAGLTGVQLHFNAAPGLPAQLRARFGPTLRILRVVHFEAASGALPTAEILSPERQDASGHDFSRAVAATKPARALAPEPPLHDPDVDAILVDSRTAKAVGGTGTSFDWKRASQILFQTPSARTLRLIAAGGLTPGNVAEAIATLRPWGVDAVSGVESSPGQKNPKKVKAFIAQAREAHQKP